MTRLLFAGVALIVVISSLSSVSSARSETSSTLFAPHVSDGQRLTWLLDVNRYAIDAHGRPSKTAVYSHVDKQTCAISQVTGERFKAAVTISVLEGGKFVTLGSRPQSTYENGQAIKQLGKPDYANCAFYARWKFGNPPPYLSVGTAWHFATPADAPLAETVETGVTTVVSMDTTRGIVGLQTVLTGSARGSREEFDVTVGDGGVILSESDETRVQLGVQGLGPFLDREKLSFSR